MSAAVYLSIAVSAVLRSARSPMAPPLARMTACLFAYEAFEILKHITPWQGFLHLECGAASLAAPTAAALVMTFLGERRRLLWLVVAGATYFSIVGLLCFAATVYVPLRAFSANPPWAIAVLVGLAPEYGYLGYLLARHARRTDARERARTQVLSLAIMLAIGGVSSDLLSIIGFATPRVAVFGLVAAALLLAALTFRLELLEGLRGLVLVNALGIAGLVLILHLVALSVAPNSVVLTATLAAAVTVAAFATLRPVLFALAEERDRTRHLATMGRFSSQMAHDLRNPLAAIRGAVQFLAEERRQGRSLDAQGAFVDLVVEQADRIAKVVEEYQRLGRAEAVRVTTDVRALVAAIADGARSSWPDSDVRINLSDVSRARVDRDLVAQALENLVRNAREATAEGPPTIEIAARRRGRMLELAVRDHGAGMDARTKERALDEFFTTKATGSGLGLAFVARVAEAHGGRVSIESASGDGTTVTMHLEDALDDGDGAKADRRSPMSA